MDLADFINQLEHSAKYTLAFTYILLDTMPLFETDQHTSNAYVNTDSVEVKNEINNPILSNRDVINAPRFYNLQTLKINFFIKYFL